MPLVTKALCTCGLLSSNEIAQPAAAVQTSLCWWEAKTVPEPALPTSPATARHKNLCVCTHAYSTWICSSVAGTCAESACGQQTEQDNHDSVTMFSRG